MGKMKRGKREVFASIDRERETYWARDIDNCFREPCWERKKERKKESEARRASNRNGHCMHAYIHTYCRELGSDDGCFSKDDG